MTGNGKTDKKFHTLQHQISVVFICLLLLSIFTITLINGLFLEKYYVSKKVEVLEEAKEVLSQMNLDDILQYDTDIEEDKKGATDEISDEIERSSSRNNLTWIIVNEENSGYYYWGENNMAKSSAVSCLGILIIWIRICSTVVCSKRQIPVPCGRCMIALQAWNMWNAGDSLIMVTIS